MWCRELRVSSCSQLHPSRILHSPSLSQPSPLPPPLFSDTPSTSAAGAGSSDLPHSSLSPRLSLPLQPSHAASGRWGSALPTLPLCCRYISPLPAGTPPHGPKNLSWARKLWSSKSSERHLMTRCLTKAGMVPKPKREAHTAYLILCCREIRLLV